MVPPPFTGPIVTHVCDNGLGIKGTTSVSHSKFFIAVATFSPPINPNMFIKMGTWLGYPSDVKKVDPLSGKGACNCLSWKGEKRGGGTTSVTHYMPFRNPLNQLARRVDRIFQTRRDSFGPRPTPFRNPLNQLARKVDCIFQTNGSKNGRKIAAGTLFRANFGL